MLTEIARAAAADERASFLLGRARECAEIYLLVSRRQKGCDGMGELAMVREEFAEAAHDLFSYCNEETLRDHSDEDLSRIAAELCACLDDELIWRSERLIKLP